MIEVESEVKDQVAARIKQLLFDSTVTQYRHYESFYSNTNQCYRFLIWKLPTDNLEEFGKTMKELIEQQGHHCIPGANDVISCGSKQNAGYKVVALYKPMS